MNTNGKVKSVLDQKNEYKNTVFGFIPKDWEIVKLKDISIRKGTYGIGAAAVEYNENLPRYLRITDIDDQGRIINEDPKCVDDPDSVNYILKKNDLVFARTGNTTGKTYLYKNEDGVLVYAGFLIKFSINPIKADSRFVKYFTETNYYWQWVGIMSMRSGQPGINENEYSKLTLPLPPLPEQQKIASILSTWDKAIELKEKLIEQKKKQKKGLMQKLLTGEVRLPGFEGEWEEYKVEDICALGRGRVISKKEIAENPGIYPVYSSQTSDEGKIGSINKYDFDGEYITWTTDGVNAGTVFYRNGKFNCTNVCGVLKLKKENIDARYLSYILQASTDKYVVRNGNPKLMNNIMAIIPIKIFNNYEYQKYICDLFDLFDKELKLLEKEVVEMKLQKKGLMQLLLTGKVRVKV